MYFSIHDRDALMTSIEGSDKTNKKPKSDGISMVLFCRLGVALSW